MVSVVMYSRDISPPGGYEVHAPAPPRLCMHPPGDARRIQALSKCSTNQSRAGAAASLKSLM